MQIRDFVNEDPPSTRWDDVSDALRQANIGVPIDAFKTSVKEIVQFGTPERLAENDFLGRLLVLSVVSAGEAYFRSILAASIEMCPVSQALSSERPVHLGGVLWHGNTGFSRSAFEHASFASVKELKKTAKDFVGFDLKDSEFKALLDEYEKVCHLRHGIVHNDGFLPGRNAIQLQVGNPGKPQEIVVRYEQLQELAAVVSNLVVTFNRELFFEMCSRWAIKWRKRGDWDPSEEDRKFKTIWNTFHSREELKTRTGKSKITRAKCVQCVKAEFGL